MQKGDPIWTELKEFGAGWWINNINILKRTIEKVSNGNVYLTTYVSDLSDQLIKDYTIHIANSSLSMQH